MHLVELTVFGATAMLTTHRALTGLVLAPASGPATLGSDRSVTMWPPGRCWHVQHVWRPWGSLWRGIGMDLAGEAEARSSPEDS
jgi:hypothetical protein